MILRTRKYGGRISNTYEYQENGACVFKWIGDFKRNKALSYYYGAQCVKLPISYGEYDAVYHLLPKSVPVSGRDFSNLYNVTTNPPETNFLRAARERDAYPLDRHLQFLEKDGVLEIGFAMGFNTEIGIMERTYALNKTHDWQIANTAKSYPRVLAGIETEENVYELVGYRTFFDATQTGDATGIFDYQVNDTTYIVIDVLEATSKGYAKTDYALNGKVVEVVESSTSFTLESNIIGYEGILFSTSGKGYAILKTV